VRGASSQHRRNRLRNRRGLIHDLSIAEPQDRDAVSLQELRALCVPGSCRIGVMLAAVDLDCELCLWCEEVEDERAVLMLATELYALEVASSQEAPQCALSVCRFAAELAHAYWAKNALFS